MTRMLATAGRTGIRSLPCLSGQKRISCPGEVERVSCDDREHPAESETMKKEDRVAAFTRELSSNGKIDDRAYYRAYFQLFNDQRYYEAHDVLEQLWLRALEPEIQFYKGLIQLAGAFVHLQKQFRRPTHPTDGRRLRPAWRLFKLAHKNLITFSPVFHGFRVEQAIKLAELTVGQLEQAHFAKNPWSPDFAPKLEQPVGFEIEPGGSSQTK
jgi:predicted metal-dependent hydrolase